MSWAFFLTKMLCARVYFVICKTFVIFNGELIVLHGEDELPASVTTVVMSSPIYIPGLVTK